MINISQYDIIVVKFPFASSLKYKARPAVVLSSQTYNTNQRDTIIISVISSNVFDKLACENTIEFWQEAGLLKPSIFKSNIITIQKDSVAVKLGKLRGEDIENLKSMIYKIC